jgi:hypothetical protein
LSLQKFENLAAVASEMQNQRAALRKQQEDYVARAAALKKELKTLKQQRSKLVSLRNPPSPTTNGFIKENDKLQVSRKWFSYFCTQFFLFFI